MDALTEYLLRENGVSKEEFEAMVEQKRIELESDPNSTQAKVKDLITQNFTNMLAMTEVYEENIKLKDQNFDTMIALTQLYESMLGGM